MKKTTFAGLTILAPGEGLESDSGAFTERDREAIDHFLRLGAKLHRHTGKPGLTNPLSTPSAAIVASGGTIAPELTISIGYTLEDEQGGETEISPLATVTTGSPMGIPTAAPSASANYQAGSLPINTYYYGLTWTDGEGGETPLGPTVGVERAPGFASGRIILNNLDFGMATAGAVGWRLYRAIGGGVFNLLATGGAATTGFIDDGTVAVDCDVQPPLDSENSTRRINSLRITLPGADANMASASTIRLYVTTTGEFGGASLLDTYPIASAGGSAIYSRLETQDASPPDVNRSVGGANQIDPDTELLDWHWKRPVANSSALGSGVQGDVRLAENTGNLYAVLAASAANSLGWVRIASAGSTAAAIGASGIQISASGSAAPQVSLTGVNQIELIGSGGVNLTESQPAASAAKIVMEGEAATLRSEGMGVIVHGANASAARGKSFKQYTWFGTVKPINMWEYDIWIEA